MDSENENKRQSQSAYTTEKASALQTHSDDTASEKNVTFADNNNKSAVKRKRAKRIFKENQAEQPSRSSDVTDNNQVNENMLVSQDTDVTDNIISKNITVNSEFSEHGDNSEQCHYDTSLENKYERKPYSASENSNKIQTHLNDTSSTTDINGNNKSAVGKKGTKRAFESNQMPQTNENKDIAPNNSKNERTLLSEVHNTVVPSNDTEKQPKIKTEKASALQSRTEDATSKNTVNDNKSTIGKKNVQRIFEESQNPQIIENKNTISEAYGHLKDNAQFHLDIINSQIEENEDKYQNGILPKIERKEAKSSVVYEADSIQIHRRFKLVGEASNQCQNDTESEKEPNATAKISYEVSSEKKYFSAQGRESHRYTVLSHKVGSSRLSAAMQEGGQLLDIVNKKGVIHGAVALSQKIDLTTSLDSNALVFGAKTIAKDTLLATETAAVTLSNKAVESTINLAKTKLENDGADNDGYRAVKTAAVITSDFISDIKTVHDYNKNKKENSAARKKDAALEKYERRQEKLEFKKEKAEYRLHSSHTKIETSSEKSQVKTSDKTTVTPNENKSRVEIKAVERTPQGFFTKKIEKHDQKTSIRRLRMEKAAAPHKYVIKSKKSIDPETGKTIRSISFERKELSANKISKGFIGDSISQINGMLHGELTVFEKKDPNLLQTLDRKITTRTVTRGANSIKEKALRDGRDNDAVQAIDGTAKFINGSGKAYDVAKSSALYVKENAKSLMQPIDNMIRNSLSSNEEKITSKTSTNRKSLLQPKEDIAKSKAKKKSGIDRLKKSQNKKNQRLVFLRNKEAAMQSAFDIREWMRKHVIGSHVGVGAAAFVIMLVLPTLLLFCAAGVGGTGTVTPVIAAVISPTEDLDLSLSEQYWTELAENLIKEYRDFSSIHTGYDKYVENTLVSSLEHDPYKLLAYLSVKCKNEDGTWCFEDAKAEIESIFYEQYELYTQETVEIRKNVTTITETEYGTSFWVPDEYAYYTTPTETFNSYDYNYCADNYCAGGEQSPLISSWYVYGTLSDVGTSNGTVYETAQDVTYQNLNYLYIEYHIQDGGVWGIWKHEYDCQTYSEEEYKTIEYGIREIKSFDSIIDERAALFDEEQTEFYELYTLFCLGHQCYISLTENTNVIDYAGYNTDIDKSDGLDNSLSVSSVMGEDVIAPCTGTLTQNGDTSCYIWNASTGYTIYLDNITVNTTGAVTKKDVIGKAASDSIVITIIDEDGNYLNPYLFIEW